MYQLKLQRHSSHSKLLRLLKHAPILSRILEVGIANGYIGKNLSQCNFEIIGIEKDKDSAGEAAEYYRKIFILDLDKEDLPRLEPFDFIILFDILEHLYEPDRTLKKVLYFLKDNGQVIISIPNIANWAIRLRLLFGNFNYSDKGILDRSHLRFFTLKTARQFIQEANLKIIHSDFTSIPFQFLVKPGWLSNCINEFYYLLVRLYPKLFAYQFIFVAINPRPVGYGRI